VTTTAHRNRHTVLNRGPQRQRDVVCVRAYNDRRGASINGGVPDTSGRLEGLILWSQYRPTYLPAKIAKHARDFTLRLGHCIPPGRSY
jgi:hypothetical protein